ncbi:MAG: Holliday junction branch migration protein RuvA [Bdellovibrionales bacterium]|nr:Holliday junction branch migration protein RuvA [Bdellovibrionales bacterium]
MIGFISGFIINLQPLIVEVGGIGYEVQVSSNLLAGLKKRESLSLWIFTSMKQDSLELYGFSSLKEKEVFLSLLKVKGIGAKMALKILGSCTWNQFLTLIKEENIKALSALPKVGKKTAQQIILSLKEKISDDMLVGSQKKNSQRNQLYYSLEKLGFHSSEIKEALNKIKWNSDFKKNMKQALTLINS